MALASSAAWADSATNHPFEGVVCYSETRKEPPTRLFVAEIDLTNPNLRLRVAPGGPDPDGAGPWQTTLMTPTRIASRDGFDLVVNGDFFEARGVKDAEGTSSRYRGDIWAAVKGPAVTDGRMWATSTNERPCLIVHRDRKVTIESRSSSHPDDWEVVAGNTLLIEAGSPVPHQNKARHPRTAAGLNADSTRLILLVVDGRKPGVALGMSYEEESVELLRWGCRQALNLDGGGSSVMALRDSSSGQFQILNQPTDGHERAVANALGISLNPKRVGAR
jgi:exopolysaccharide biosynthesis protein